MRGNEGKPHRVPLPGARGKGVLVSPTVHGNLIVGPSAVPTEEAERPKTTADGLAFVKEQALQSVPGIDFRNSIRNFAGNPCKYGQK